MDVCQYSLNTSIKGETKQTLEHHLTQALAQALPSSLSKSTEDNYILHPLASTDQRSLWPSRLKVPGNMCKCVGLYPALRSWKHLSSPSGVPDGLVWILLVHSLSQGIPKERCRVNTSSWWPEKGEFTCMTSTSLHITVACSFCTLGFPHQGCRNRC